MIFVLFPHKPFRPRRRFPSTAAVFRCTPGRPLKGVSIKKTPPLKKSTAVSLLHFSCYRLRVKAASYSVSRPLFLFMVRVVFDPHQSPIWFKASVFCTAKHRPFRFGGPENRRCHAGSNCMLADHMVINQPHCGYRHRRIKIINRLRVQQVPIRPDGLLPAPRMVQCCTQSHYRNNLFSSKAT